MRDGIGGFEWQLDNWMRWCRKKDWLPLGHVCNVAMLMRRAKQSVISASDTGEPIYEQHALGFNRLVMMLPRRHMDVFLLNHLDKGTLGHMIVYTRRPETKFRLAGLTRPTFYRRAAEADNMIKRWMNGAE